MAGKTENIVMADSYMDHHIWSYNEHHVKYCFVNKQSLEGMTHAVMDKLKYTKTPLNMTVNIYQKFAGERSNISLERSTADIMRVAQENKRHKV